MQQPEDFAGWRPVAGSPQEKFLQRTEFEGMYGGAAGGMKTETLINLPVEDILKVPNISVAFFRRQYGQMEDVIARARELFVPLGAEYNESKHRFTFQNGSRYYFHHMQHEKDKLVYQGRKFEIVLFDELTHFTESQYLYLFSRCRGNPKVKWRVRSATNPGGVGHGWVKRRWIEALKPYKTSFFLKINGEDVKVHPTTPYARSRFWMPAKVWDNPYLRDTDYVANLMALDPELRAMLLEGEWDIFSGQFFSMWRKAIHVVEPFRLPEHWNYFGGFDYGHRNPTAYVIGAVDPDGGVWIVREHYMDNKSVEWHAREIKKLEASLPFGVKVKARLADPSIWTRTPQETEAGTDDSIAMMYGRHGIDFIKANNQRVLGWSAMKEYLDWEDKAQFNGDLKSIVRLPRMRIFANCTNLIRTLPDLVYEEVENRRSTTAMMGEDLDTRGDDHVCFVAGTKVMTISGEKNIESIKVGDLVLTRDGFKQVLNAGMTKESAEVYRYEFSDGRYLDCTADHPIIANGKKIAISKLTASDTIYTLSGNVLARANTAAIPLGNFPVYNLTVKDKHEYFANGILVSNCDATRYLLMHVYNPVIKKLFKNDWRTKLKMTRQNQRKKTIVSFT